MFINFWYPLEWSEKLTDQPLKRRMLGQDFVIFRDSAGFARCLSNTCVHRGGSLAGGKVKGDCVECPYHGWQFDGQGHCHRIPSLGSAAKIPGRVRVDAYPVEERYGIVFAFLGDLPEGERPPIMPVETFGQDGWHATFQEFLGEVNYRRQLENSLDPAHNEFVHPTHGFSGERDDYYVPQLDVKDTEWGSGFLTTYYAPPLKDEKMKAASERSKNAVIEAGTFHHGPNCLLTRIHPTSDHFLHQHAFKTPVDGTQTRTFLVQMRNFLLGAEHDDRFHVRNDVVAGQDAEVLADLEPVLTPETNNHELLMPADQAVARYREKLRKWETLGWRIDVNVVDRNSKRVAYAIPSPARRERAKGWILDPVPLMPCRAVGVDQVNAGATG